MDVAVNKKKLTRNSKTEDLAAALRVARRQRVAAEAREKEIRNLLLRRYPYDIDVCGLSIRWVTKMSLSADLIAFRGFDPDDFRLASNPYGVIYISAEDGD